MHDARPILTILTTLFLAPATILAGDQVDDYESPPDGGFNNPFFSNVIGIHEVNDIGPFSSFFQDSESVSPTHTFFLVGTDYVTFNLNPGEFVSYAEVWYKGYGAPSHFHVIGEDALGMPVDFVQQSAASGPFVLVDTAGAGFARIDEIRLSGLEGGFDDLRVTVVPEPSTLALLGLGALVAVRRWRAA